MRSKSLSAAFYIIAMIMAMIYGMVSEKYDLPPSNIVRTLYHKITTTKPQRTYPIEFLQTPQEYLKNDVGSLISIRHKQDVYRLREKLIKFLWGAQGIPSSLPSLINKGISDSRYSDINSLARIDRITINMEFGINSISYHFIPKAPNNKAVIYIAGHDQDFYDGKSRITQLLDEGYSVVAFAMPLSGLNNQPTVFIPKIGLLKLISHDDLKFLSPIHGHPVKYFIEPEVITLNYLSKEFSYTSISMIGFSSGGWTASLAAAVDPRIQKSFPVAGSLPIYLRSNSPRDWDDYEQTVPELYKTVNYMEIYILGSYGPQRMELQILNQFDPCCFAGTKSETYKNIVINRLRDLGTGKYDLFLDTNPHNGHSISDVAMQKILDELKKSD